jgi:hypothetical protein
MISYWSGLINTIQLRPDRQHLGRPQVMLIAVTTYKMRKKRIHKVAKEEHASASVHDMTKRSMLSFCQ